MGERQAGPGGGKITAGHRCRDAVIYVRQSTLAQTQENLESLALQYDLRRHAAELGWGEHQITVIDEDLARSAATTSGRLGFTDLVAAVGLGKVGIIVGREVSRLARNNTDWYQVLDLCSITDTLIADSDGIYHPGDFNDRLVLGLKGQMAEAELHMLRMRLTAALRHKAARGELRQLLPVGLDYDDDGRVVLCDDEAVRAAIRQVHALFAQLGSARQVMMTLREQGLLLPRRKAGARRVTWAEASYPAVHDFLTNPAYGGAFVFGRTRTEKRVDPSTGKVAVRTRLMPQDQWEVLIPGHHPGYLDWAAWQDNQVRLRANYRAPRGDGGGAARRGAALLSGLVRCGKCGRMMQVGYSGHGGDAPRYLCGRGTQLYGTPPCQSIGGVHLHRAVLDQMFQVLQPASLEATAHAMADAEQRHREQVAAFETALERARFEADRAMRKHDEVEPGNRLVARTLEARLEERLAAAGRAEAALAAARARHPVQLTSEELAWLSRAGADLRAVFDTPAVTNSQRKQLIRAVISEITLSIDRQERTCDVLIAWQGTATTAVTIPLPKRGAGAVTTSEGTLDLVRRLARDYNDTTIAQILGRQHRRTATGLAWTRDRVSSLRRSHGIPHCPDAPGNVSGTGHDHLMASVPQAAQLLGVDKTTIYRWLKDGFITGQQLTPGAPWRIRVDQALRDKIRPTAPDGWLPLDQAAKVLGIAPQTVLHKVQTGRLQAIHVTSGRRKGLRIQVGHDQPGLFDTSQGTKGAVLTMADGSQDQGAVGGLGEPEACQLVPQLLVVADGGGGVPGLQPHVRVQAGGAGAAGSRSVVAAGDFVGEQQLEEVVVRHVVLAGEGEPVGEGGQELAELEGAQVLFEVGADRVGQGHGCPFSVAGCGGPAGPGAVGPGPAGGFTAAVPGCAGWPRAWCRAGCRRRPAEARRLRPACPGGW
jgi:excisionase family DNA binding protein